MIIRGLRPTGQYRETLPAGPHLTVLADLGPAQRRALIDQVRATFEGRGSDVLIAVEVDGRSHRLTPDLVKSCGVEEMGTIVVLAPADLPGAREVEPAKVAPEPADPAATARAEAEAQDELTDAAHTLREAERATAALHQAEERLAAARAEAAAAREQREHSAAADRGAKARAAEREEHGERIEHLRAEHARLEASRAALVRRMGALPDPGAPGPVEAALRDLRAVEASTRPSAQAAEVAERWVVATKQLADLPAPPQPPEWLVIPALAALQEARSRLAEAESGGRGSESDETLVDALERAHRSVLDAEQRAMRKGSRLNRRRLEQAHQAERAALEALGVATYGDYLQRVAPARDDGTSAEQRIADARAALADAEAVWEELHGGEASPEWTRAKEEQAAVRAEAFSLLGREVPDDRLEDELRAHTETVVERAPAEEALVAALGGAGAAAPRGADVEETAEQWLRDSPGQRAARAELARELAELDERIAAMAERLAEHQADAFFGEVPAPDPPTDGGDEGVNEHDQSVGAAESAEAEAEEAVARARGVLESTGADLDALRQRLAAAESRLAELRARPPAPVEPAAPEGVRPTVDLSGAVSMEVEVFVLARLNALRAASGGPLPLFVDSAIASLLPARAARRLLAILGRAADSVQIIVLGNEGDVVSWARSLGDRALVHGAK